jgi:heterodisulfide reductase subunit A-like polyferredoxin
MKEILASLFGKDRPSPSYPDRPDINRKGESNIRGVFLVGEIAGTSLIKACLNEGYDLAERLAGEVEQKGPFPLDYDVAVVGCGVAGAATGVRLQELGKRVIILEAGKTFQTLRTFTRGKILLDEPAHLDRKSTRLNSSHNSESRMPSSA